MRRLKFADMKHLACSAVAFIICRSHVQAF
jgi:hypothetical protein